MKVLTFCAYYEPEIAASMYLLTNLFEDAAKEGIVVELFAPTPTRGVDKETVKRYKKIKEEVECDNRLKIHRFSMIQEGKNIIGRTIRYLLVNAAFLWKGIRTKADVLFIDSTPPTQGVVAALLKKIKRIPVVYNLQDVFPDSLVHTGICSERSIIYKIGAWVERVTYRNADKIIVISEDFKQNILKKNVPESKIEIVYNWVDEKSVFRVKREQNPLFDQYKIDRNKFYIAYSGNIGLTQNMELLVEAALILRDYAEIGFIIVGDGAYRKELETRINEQHLNNITLLPFQPYSEIANVFSLGDIGLIISKPGVGNNSVPSKTWSYMAAETPVLASFDSDSELCSFVRKNQCGWCVEAGAVEEFCSTILDLYSRRKDIQVAGINGRNFIDANLSRKVGTQKYIDVIKSVRKES